MFPRVLPWVMLVMFGWAAVPAECWRAVPSTSHDPASALELAGKLSALAALEKERGDHMSAWLFASAAAKVRPGRKDLTVAALEATKILIPALLRDHVDAAAMALAHETDADAATATSASGVAAAAVRKSHKEAWETAPDWLRRLEGQVSAMLANPDSGDERTLGESRHKQKLGCAAVSAFSPSPRLPGALFPSPSWCALPLAGDPVTHTMDMLFRSVVQRAAATDGDHGPVHNTGAAVQPRSGARDGTLDRRHGGVHRIQDQPG